MRRISTLFLLLLFATGMFAQNPVLHLNFDENSCANVTHEAVNGTGFETPSHLGCAERISGIYGNALRTDGFSVWAKGNTNISATTQLTVETWVALESFPSDMETVYDGLTPSAFVSQFEGNNGFQLGINTFGDWWFKVSVNGTMYTCKAPDEFPLYEWVHVAGVVDASAGTMSLYLNGVSVATAPTGTGSISMANVPLYVGRSNQEATMGIFFINALNAAFDETKVYTNARSKASLSDDYQAGKPSSQTAGMEAIAVPKSRFANDLQRPVFHGMPPANWTNEPHGLMKYNGEYHMFYQRTPNGPYKTQMHWGHMVSSDFVNWRNEKDALYPTLEWSETSGYDMKGIWSGDVIEENGTAYAFYTCVNHSGPYNPGVALATSNDAGLVNWTKEGPIIDKTYADDFRDPYLFKANGKWNMIIGARTNGHGGLVCYESTDLRNWSYNANFCSADYGQMDIGSAIWEMPVFEELANGKWLLIVNPIGGSVSKYGPEKYTRGVYWIGTYSNGTFTPDYTEPKMLDLIHGHLSPTVARNSNNQLTGIGMVDERWSSQAQLDAGWCHVYSAPRVYSLMPDQKTLGQAPAPQLATLRKAETHLALGANAVNGTRNISTGHGHSVEIIANVDENTTGTKYGLNFALSNDRSEITSLYYDAVAKQIVLDKSKSTNSSADEEAKVLRGNYDEAAFGKPTKFHVFIDHSIIDVFINDAAAFSARIYPTKDDSQNIELYSEGTTSFSAVNIWALDEAEPIPSTKLSLADDGELKEHEENGEVLTLTLKNNAFNSTLDFSSWTVSNLPAAVTALSENFTRISDTEVQLVLTGSTPRGDCSFDYDEDIKNVTIEVPASEFVDQKNTEPVKGTGALFVAEVETQTTLNLSSTLIIEGQEAGAEILVTVQNNTFASIDPSQWNIQNLPTGLSATVSLVDAITAKITLSGQSEDYDEDITNLSVCVDKAAFETADGEICGTELCAEGQVTFQAIAGFINYNFETGDLRNWQILDCDGAFSIGDVVTDSTWHGGLFNQEQMYHLWGFAEGGDTQTGAMRTGVFSLEGDGLIKALIAGGNNPDSLYLALVRASDDQILVSATGNDSERYTEATLDASAFIGESCYLKAVDLAVGGWGHLNLDNIRVPVPDNDTMPAAPSSELTGISISTTNLTLELGTSEQLSVEAIPCTASLGSVSWTSSNTDVAVVDAKGMLSAVGEGTVVISATTASNFTAHVNVTVNNILVLDFEKGDLSDWTVLEGNAFSNANVTDISTFWAEEFPFNHQATYHLWGFLNVEDAAKGKMRSKHFTLGGDGQVSLLVAGGNQPDSLYVALVRTADNVVLAKVTGTDSEAYSAKTIDASAHIGTDCYILVADLSTGGWGHINVDNVRVPVTDTNYVPVVSVAINEPTPSLNVGANLQLSTTILPSNATNKTLTWTSSNVGVVTVSNGLLQGISAGTATVTAKSVDGAETSVSVTVNSIYVPVTSVSLNPSSLSLNVGESASITAEILPANASNKSLTWTSSDENVATVNNGQVQAVGNGTATITASSADGASASISVTVSIIYIPVTDVVLSPSSLALSIGESGVFALNISPENASDKTIAWTSSDETIASVNNGQVLALAEGTVAITAISVDGPESTATVTVSDVQPNPDFLVYDFETGDLTGWTRTGDAFTDDDVCKDNDWGWGGPFNQQGEYLLWGHKAGGDSRTGSIKTAPFTLGGDGQISFMIGGGFDINTLYLALVRASDGAILMKATGDNNDSEALVEKSFDATAFIGTECYIQLVDNHTSGWGHINLDNVIIPVGEIAVESVSLNQSSMSLALNASAALQATVAPSSATNKNVIWTSSDASIVSVDASGNLTANAVGSATISVTTVDGNYTDVCAVSVYALSNLVFDFETGDLSNWIPSGNAFTEADVCSDTDWGWGGPFGQQGTYHLWGHKAGDDSRTGELRTATNFVVGGNGQISMMIGGGFDINSLYVALVRVSDNAELMKLTGDNNDSEAYVSKTMNASAYVGTECYIKIVDNSTGGWGHINVDNIVVPVQSAKKAFVAAPTNRFEEVKVFPNPVQQGELIMLSIPNDLLNDLSISVYSMKGQLLIRKQNTNSGVQQIETQNLGKGMYIIQLASPEGRISRNVIVK